jgi:hypothetical protein
MDIIPIAAVINYDLISDLASIAPRTTNIANRTSDIYSIRKDRYALLTRAHSTGASTQSAASQSSIDWVRDANTWRAIPIDVDNIPIVDIYSTSTEPPQNPKLSIVGHGGVEATIRNLNKIGDNDTEAMRTILEWTNMRQDVRTFVRHCPCCQKMARLKLPIQTRPFTIASYGLWDCVAMDSIGPLTPTADGYTYLLVIIDTFSRFVELIPIKDTKAITAANAIIPFVGRYGIPSAFLTDNATQFVNQVIKELMGMLDCNHITIHPHSHEENGIVERANKEVKRHIRDLIFDTKQPDKWDLVVPFVQRIINSQKHRATGVTPTELVFGKSLDLDRNILTTSTKYPRMSLSDHIATLINMQEHTLHKAMLHQNASDTHHVERAIKRGNQNRETEFPLHSYVLVQYENRGGPTGDHAPPTALHPILRGPFRVVNKHNRDAQGTIYTCEHLATHKLEDFHVKLLQPFRYDERHVLPEDIAQTDYNLFTVESILKHRWTPGKNRTKRWLQFLVKWEGYSDADSTWEPWENVSKNQYLQTYLRKTPALKHFANNNLVNDPAEL